MCSGGGEGMGGTRNEDRVHGVQLRVGATEGTSLSPIASPWISLKEL